jgi:hypothetical protein
VTFAKTPASARVEAGFSLSGTAIRATAPNAALRASPMQKRRIP